MHFSSLFLTGALAALASAQSPASSSAVVATPTNPVSPAQSSITACLARCAEGDVNCRAGCITVPSPDESQVKATNDCVERCPKGNGTDADAETYKQCLNQCIANFYYQSSVGTPNPTGSPNAGDSSSSVAPSSDSPSSAPNSANTAGSSRSSASPTSSGSARSSSTSASAAGASSSNAAPAVVGSSGAALGFLAALFAL